MAVVSDPPDYEVPLEERRRLVQRWRDQMDQRSPDQVAGDREREEMERLRVVRGKKALDGLAGVG